MKGTDMAERSVKLTKAQLDKSKELIGKVKAGETVQITITGKRTFILSA